MDHGDVDGSFEFFFIDAFRKVISNLSEKELAKLTPRQKEWVALAKEGLMHKQIGDRLGISEQASKNLSARICEIVDFKGGLEELRKKV